MKKIMIFILAAIIGFSSVMTPFYSKAAMASDIALDAEVSELFYTIMINAMVAAGFMEADEMEYDDAMSCFESFCDAVVPVGTRTDSAGYAVDSSGNRLILLQNSAGAAIDLSNIITDGTSALKPAKEQWEKFKVIQGGSGGSNNNPLGNGNIDSAVLGAPIFEAARAWLLSNQNSLPVQQQVPGERFFSGVVGERPLNGIYTMISKVAEPSNKVRKYVYEIGDYTIGADEYLFYAWDSDRQNYYFYSFHTSDEGCYYVNDIPVTRTAYFLDGTTKVTKSKFPSGFANKGSNNQFFSFVFNFNVPEFATREDGIKYARYIFYGETLPDGVKVLNCPFNMPGLISLVPSMFDVIAGRRVGIQDLLKLKPALKYSLDRLPDFDVDPAVNNENYKNTVRDTVEKTVPATDPAQDPIIAPVPDADIKKYTYDLSTVFPFCVPFDLVALLKTLCADAKTPKFEVPIAFPAIDYEYTFVIDLSFLDSAAQVFRACITISFILALISITPKMIKW